MICKMSKQIKKAFRSVILSAGILGLVLFFVTMAFCLITIMQINRQMGFSYATPETSEGELFIIQKVVHGKIMHEAGLQEYDRVLMPGPNNLYRRLIRNQGSEVLIPVSRDGEQLIIKVMAPELEIPCAGLCIFLKIRPYKNGESLPAGN
jgi:hypothetical protein